MPHLALSLLGQPFLPSPAFTPEPPFLHHSFLFQEDLPELLGDMVLGPLLDEGSSGLAIAPQPPLSPNLDNLPNLAPQENPLRQLLAEERECQAVG